MIVFLTGGPYIPNGPLVKNVANVFENAKFGGLARVDLLLQGAGTRAIWPWRGCTMLGCRIFIGTMVALTCAATPSTTGTRRWTAAGTGIVPMFSKKTIGTGAQVKVNMVNI